MLFYVLRAMPGGRQLYYLILWHTCRRLSRAVETKDKNLYCWFSRQTQHRRRREKSQIFRFCLPETFRKALDKTSVPCYNHGVSLRGVAQIGSALGSGPRGRRFKSCHSDHIRIIRTLSEWERRSDFLSLLNIRISMQRNRRSPCGRRNVHCPQGLWLCRLFGRCSLFLSFFPFCLPFLVLLLAFFRFKESRNRRIKGMNDCFYLVPWNT